MRRGRWFHRHRAWFSDKSMAIGAAVLWLLLQLPLVVGSQTVPIRAREDGFCTWPITTWANSIILIVFALFFITMGWFLREVSAPLVRTRALRPAAPIAAPKTSRRSALFLFLARQLFSQCRDCTLLFCLLPVMYCAWALVA